MLAEFALFVLTFFVSAARAFLDLLDLFLLPFHSRVHYSSLLSLENYAQFQPVRAVLLSFAESHHVPGYGSLHFLSRSVC